MNYSPLMLTSVMFHCFVLGTASYSALQYIADYVTLRCVVFLCYAVFYHTGLHLAVLCCLILYCTVPCVGMLCCVGLLCSGMFWFVTV